MKQKTILKRKINKKKQERINLENLRTFQKSLVRLKKEKNCVINENIWKLYRIEFIQFQIFSVIYKITPTRKNEVNIRLYMHIYILILVFSFSAI